MLTLVVFVLYSSSSAWHMLLLGQMLAKPMN